MFRIVIEWWWNLSARKRQFKSKWSHGYMRGTRVPNPHCACVRVSFHTWFEQWSIKLFSLHVNGYCNENHRFHFKQKKKKERRRRRRKIVNINESLWPHNSFNELSARIHMFQNGIRVFFFFRFYHFLFYPFVCLPFLCRSPGHTLVKTSFSVLYIFSLCQLVLFAL